jgi:glycosyltransferase involved in cell wall biosynthesis
VRVLVWGELFWPYIGGAELFAARLMDALGGRGHRFAVITSQDYLDLPDQAHYHDIPIYRFRFREALAPGRVEELATLCERATALVDELAPEVILLNGVGPNAFFCLHAARVTHTPLIVRLNRQPPPDRLQPRRNSLLRRALEQATWVIGVSRAMLDAARRLVPGIEPHSSLIYNGVDVPSATPAAPAVDAQRVLCLGRLVSDKGFDVAIAALPAILQRCPQARLIIAGDGPERGPLEQQARDVGVDSAVEFVGWIAPDAVVRVMATVNVVVVPSRSEGLPAVALQAAAMCRPVVASRHGGLLDIIDDGRTGVLVGDDAAELADAVAALLEQPAVAVRMGANAGERARDVFGQQRCVDAYDALCRQVGARR